MDPAISNALKRKKEIKSLIESMLKELEEIDVFLALHRRFARTNPESADVTQPKDSTRFLGRAATRDAEPVKTSREHRRGNPAAIVNMVRGILKDEQRAMTRGELAEEIERRGTPLPGIEKADRAKYVGTILWRRSDLFENHEGKGYWFSGQPIPNAGRTAEAKRYSSMIEMLADHTSKSTKSD